MLEYSGIIFDFNGTLFWDSEKHEKAWRDISKKLRGYELTDKEFQKKVHGRTNNLILEYIIGQTLDNKKVLELSLEKERIYRELCINDEKNLKLAPGVVELLDYLKQKNIPLTIATSCEKTNLEFYIEVFNLKKWFDINKIVYFDGSFLGKPEPDVYLKAAEKIGINPEQCVVVEDAISGIEAALRAGIGYIAALAPKDKYEYFLKVKGVKKVISDFNEFDKELLKK